MQATSVSVFRKNIKKYFDQVVEDQDILIVTRHDGKAVVVMPLEMYNSLTHTKTDVEKLQQT